ncbi:anti-sigma factor family protein [Paraburkholderia sp. 2C]|jgi:predicted anti-sigma-YlaC factor YlaD
MRHTHRSDLLSGYLDRELGPVETFWVEYQLATCKRCQEIYAVYEGLNMRLRSAYLCVEVPEELAERIRALSRNQALNLTGTGVSSPTGPDQ